MGKISRRAFLQAAGKSALGVAAASILPGSIFAMEEPPQGGDGAPSGPMGGPGSTYTAGTYTATGQGRNGDVTVTMTFEEESITDVVIDLSGETLEIVGDAADKLAKAILEGQTADVDAVTGATLSSEGVKEAAAKCIAQAKGVPYEALTGSTADPSVVTKADGTTTYYSMRRSWVVEAPAIAEKDIAGEYSADVVVIGANYSGAPCFRMACEKGCTCIVIDSQPEDGFNSYGGELGHFNSTWQEEVMGVPKSTFDPTDFIDNWQLQSAGRAQPDLIRKFAQRNGEIVDWMFEVYDDIHDIRPVATIDQAENSYSYHKGHFWTYPATATLGSGNMATSGDFCKAQVQKGIEASPDSQAFYEMTAKVLIKDGDTVCGCICQSEKDGLYYRFMSKRGVVLATGDFSANSEMYSALCTEVQECNPYTRLTGAGRSGYGHRMGIWAGGVMEIGPRAAMGGNTSALPFGFFGAAGGLWINKYGKRFCNECFGAPFVAGCQSARLPIGSAIVQVWDQGHWRAFAQNQSLGHFNAADISDAKMDEYQAKLDEAYAAGPNGANGVYAADDLETLASYLGFEGKEAENFVSTVQTYDSYAENGKDPDYAKSPDMLFRISEPPFYAEKNERNANLVLVTLAGLFVNGDGQVLNQSFEPIPGLYAVGNASGGRFPLQYTSPMNGISIGMATVLGALTGEFIATEGEEVSSGDSATSAMGTV